jgi:CheY-like chemotaxis protein
MTLTFTIAPDWKVLVLEDMPERIAWFKERLPQAVYATTADAAIEALKSREFRAVFLDHDLHWMHANNTIVKGTGKEVALYLKKTSFPGVIVIHSKHDEAADVMHRILPHAKLARFGEFEIVSANGSGR